MIEKPNQRFPDLIFSCNAKTNEIPGLPTRIKFVFPNTA